ncbi:hypothetical protein CGGC5_v010477 [Colletotrichum fructicola Nara gc5]|uniref:Uncharacterized protein n=1 Tax=Colletotrichum fructicola (strain Nara gc5) TaxID=1213859 RepID=L2FR74_COLFN|nr:hypothetical protein CFRS1_v013608 [Colletotrichum fructicola]KAF4480660.1 hypothetical protein CGGC5_v010477 [Colletotrichum fructicola Nara gc5]KAF5488338.1 hypothetical protein CGCF413_v012075 [Colletotrichum fructicola]
MAPRHPKDHQKAYFILRSADYEPDCLIQLGQLIEDPHAPYRRIAPPLKPIPADIIHSSLRGDWYHEESSDKAGNFGVFAQFLAAVAAEMSAQASQEFTQSWSASQLETSFLELGAARECEYVTNSVKEAAVQKLLTRDSFFKRAIPVKKIIYMVTGLKIAKSPGIMTSEARRTIGGFAKLSGDPGTGGAISAGFQGGADRSKGTVESSVPCGDFVFAYRLRKIHVSFSNKVTLGNDVSGGELHGTGAASADDDSSYEDDSDEEASEELVDANEIDRILVENDDFGPSLPARDTTKEVIDGDDSDKCLIIMAD